MKTKTTITILLLLVLFSCSTTTAQVLQQDSLALVAFYNSTGGPNWNNNSNWLNGPVGTWYGVTVEADRVIELTLYQNNLNGTIPIEVGNLTEIKKLKLGHDEGLEGEIPESIGNLLQLEVFVICNCSSLTNLSLWENNLTGPIPPELGNLDSLIFLDLHDNQLTGPIPPELGNCTNLLELRLNNNQLSGELPEELASINSLNTFNVSYNDLSGPVPDEFSYQISYWFFYVNNNNFDYLPPFNNWYLLSGLMVENNKLTFEHLESHAQSGYMWFNYSPQDSMMEEIDTALVPGSSYSIYSGTGGEFTNYKWFKNGEMILESPDADTLHIENISYADTGTYTCHAENSLLNLLNLHRKLVHITIDTGVFINTLPVNYNKIELYPNPATEFVSIVLPGKSETTDLKIFDMEGRCVFSRESLRLMYQKAIISIAGLKPGIYLLNVLSEERHYTTKLIINKRGKDR